MPLSEEEVRSICAQLLHTTVDTIEFPGGSSRESVRVNVAGQGLIVTRRKNLQRAKLECGVLRTLNRDRAPVPHLIAFKDNELIQQDVGQLRLSEAMHTASAEQVVAHLRAALGSLHAIHQIGIEAGPLQSLAVLGNTTQWLGSFARSAERLGAQTGLSAPQLDYDKLVNLLRIEQPSFIKWDARPGNAIVRENGTIIWIDWEHCGKRHPLDDVAWLLADEYTPYLPEIEETLIPEVAPVFGSGLSASQAVEYLRVFGTLHSCIRLALIWRYYAKDAWWDIDRCLALDKVGVVKELATRAAQRATNWAEFSPLTRSLAPWLQDLQSKIANSS